MTENKGIMLVVSGPAGSGKGTVNAMLLKRDDFAFSVSATTRAARPGEVDGVNYHFITRESFLERIDSGDMLEYTEYCGNFYGTPLKEAEEVLRSGKNLILEIEVEGAMNVKRKYPDAVLVLLLPPSYSVQEARLRGRGTETEEKILLRLARAKEEVALADCYDYVVYNYDNRADEAAAHILSIVDAEKCSIKRNDRVADKYLNS
ncbi:MAG: guanylate kinase [Clostridia bacterium]|jgi:guanylate kinase|nr:guanylate kinase [Clostridia bacterium]MBQ2384842.1 guanylate kinase [Clostridia bacterium]MBR2850120.1 guanylate kinase [Clostridia bacterium]